MQVALALSLAFGLSGAPGDGSVPPAALGLPAQPAPPAEPPPPPEPEQTSAPAEADTAGPSHRHIASWVLLGLGGASLLTGGALNVAAASAANSSPTALATGTFSSTPQANALWTGAIACYSVGAALGLAGAIVYYFEAQR